MHSVRTAERQQPHQRRDSPALHAQALGWTSFRAKQAKALRQPPRARWQGRQPPAALPAPRCPRTPARCPDPLCCQRTSCAAPWQPAPGRQQACRAPTARRAPRCPRTPARSRCSRSEQRFPSADAARFCTPAEWPGASSLINAATPPHSRTLAWFRVFSMHRFPSAPAA